MRQVICLHASFCQALGHCNYLFLYDFKVGQIISFRHLACLAAANLISLDF
jgi:hypothetical protein